MGDIKLGSILLPPSDLNRTGVMLASGKIFSVITEDFVLENNYYLYFI